MGRPALFGYYTDWDSIKLENITALDLPRVDT